MNVLNMLDHYREEKERARLSAAFKTALDEQSLRPEDIAVYEKYEEEEKTASLDDMREMLTVLKDTVKIKKLYERIDYAKTLATSYVVGSIIGMVVRAIIKTRK